MPTLTITRGLPGSGKTTWAQALVLASAGQVVRVNRDDLRASMFGVGKTVLPRHEEEAVTAVQRVTARALLEVGRSVIIDDTNLRLKFARQWADLAAEVGAQFVVDDRFLDVPLDRCIARDAARPDSVGEAVIRGMHDQCLSGGRTLPPVTPTVVAVPAVEPYVPPVGLGVRDAWVVDIDGTLALLNGRDPYSEDVGNDGLNEPVAELVAALHAQAYWIILMSGRKAVTRAATLAWLHKHGILFDDLLMRADDDNRKDVLVKLDLFNEHVRHRYDVHGVIDDRDPVVKLWRAMGLTVAQVNEGNF